MHDEVRHVPRLFCGNGMAQLVHMCSSSHQHFIAVHVRVHIATVCPLLVRCITSNAVDKSMNEQCMNAK